MQPETPVAVVLAWHTAVNNQNVSDVLRYSAPDIEIVGPRGSAYGHGVLRDWLARVGLAMEPYRWFVRGAAVVTAAHGVWRSVESGEVIGSAEVASYFQVENGTVRHYARFDTLAEALAAADLTDADEISS